MNTSSGTWALRQGHAYVFRDMRAPAGICTRSIVELSRVGTVKFWLDSFSLLYDVSRAAMQVPHCVVCARGRVGTLQRCMCPRRCQCPGWNRSWGMAAFPLSFSDGLPREAVEGRGAGGAKGSGDTDGVGSQGTGKGGFRSSLVPVNWMRGRFCFLSHARRRVVGKLCDLLKPLEQDVPNTLEACANAGIVILFCWCSLMEVVGRLIAASKPPLTKTGRVATCFTHHCKT